MPAPTGSDRVAWDDLDRMTDLVHDLFDARDAYLEAYVVNGTTLPGYRISWEESIP